MESTHRTPQHGSYRRHRRQTAWQIIVPVVLACVLLAGLAYVLSVAALNGTGDLARWADVSAMWISLPFMIGALLLTLVLGGVAFLVGKLAGIIPPYTLKAQEYARKMEAGARQVEHIGHKPLDVLPHIGRLIKTAFWKLRHR